MKFKNKPNKGISRHTLSRELKEFCDKEGYTNISLHIVMPLILDFIEKKYNIFHKKS